MKAKIKAGDTVLYVGKYKGKVLKNLDVKLEDGTIIGSLNSQPHKFVKVSK